MYQMGDKVRVKDSGAVGLIHEVVTEKQLCVEFDHCANSREIYQDEQLVPIPETAALGSSFDFATDDI